MTDVMDNAKFTVLFRAFGPSMADAALDFARKPVYCIPDGIVSKAPPQTNEP